jgi:hypothetical protein
MVNNGLAPGVQTGAKPRRLKLKNQSYFHYMKKINFWSDLHDLSPGCQAQSEELEPKDEAPRQ